MSDEQIIRNCAPTLAGIKTASLFSCEYRNRQEIEDSLRYLNSKICTKGLVAVALVFREKSALIYIYRPPRLRRDLNDPLAREILSAAGYSCTDLHGSILTLENRLRDQSSFPHEIGLFLGYPPEDVAGFIRNDAKGYKTVGYWKVYGDAVQAEKIFTSYRKCTDTYYKQWLQGRTLEHLVVAC